MLQLLQFMIHAKHIMDQYLSLNFQQKPLLKNLIFCLKIDTIHSTQRTWLEGILHLWSIDLVLFSEFCLVGKASIEFESVGKKLLRHASAEPIDYLRGLTCNCSIEKWTHLLSKVVQQIGSTILQAYISHVLCTACIKVLSFHPKTNKHLDTSYFQPVSTSK